MRLLFLDVDGVLNNHSKLPSGYCGMCRPMVDRLNRILDAVPDSQIVVSSAWRYLVGGGSMTLRGFESLMLVSGVKAYGRVRGITDPDPDGFGPDECRHLGMVWRVEQITEYVQRETVGFQVPRYAVLDDLALDLPREVFVQTDGAVGLTDADAARVIEILTRG